jgi:anhydro-N-acetylmuramic acid kinase
MRRLLIGLSSGSSAGSVDAALVEASGVGMNAAFRPLHSLRLPLPRDVRELMMRLTSELAGSFRQLGWVHRALGESYVAAIQKLALESRTPLAQVFGVGLSEWTPWHDADARYPTMLSFGMAECIAESTGLSVVADFHQADTAAGGQGVPFVPAVDRLLFGDRSESRVLLHVGHIASLVSLPGDDERRNGAAFQAAPAGLLLDGLMRKLTQGREAFDAGGKHAVQGRCIDDLLERWLALPILQRKPPKMIPPEDFGEAFVSQAVSLAKARDRSLHDVLCTATHFVARSIVDAIRKLIPIQPERVLVSGGGVRNGFLWNLIEQGLRPIPVERTDIHGIPADVRKVTAIAVLAALAFDSVAANSLSLPGSKRARPFGRFVPGTEENWRRCLEWMSARQTLPRLAAA